MHKKYAIQYIRIAAAILIVYLHVRTAIGGYAQGSNSRLDELNIGFTFAAGYLFRHLSLRQDYGQFIQRKVRNVIVPYLVISIPALLIYVVGGKAHPNVDLSAYDGLGLTLYLLVTGLHLGPLWFIPMISLLYLCTPVFRRIDAWKAGYLVVLPVSLLLALTVFPRPTFNENPLLAAAHYVPVFLIGMIASRYEKAATVLAVKVKWGLIGLFGLLVFVAVDAGGWHQYYLKILMLVTVYLFFLNFEQVGNATIDKLASYSFGIYLLHGYLVSLVKVAAGRGWLQVIYPFWDAAFLTVLVTSVSIMLLIVARSVFASRSKYLIGY